MPNNDFDKYRSVLAEQFPYVEDETFAWSDVVGLLILQLANTDSLNKANAKSHATQIQITSPKDAEEARSTEDFFPTLVLNQSFKSWRLSIPTRIHANNINQLNTRERITEASWMPDSIQIRRRLLNEDTPGHGNPNLQLCYGNDLMPLRELLNVGDYLVIVKQRKQMVYEAFGVRGTVDLGGGKKMYLSDDANRDAVAFRLQDVIVSDAVSYQTGYSSKFSRNRIVFGAPGTGKSYTLNGDRKELLYGDRNADERSIERLMYGEYERVTFHPDYS